MQSSFIPVVALIAILLLVHSEQVPQSGDGAELKVDGVSSDDINEPQPSKRSWKQLHGGWGKRSEELFQAGDNLKDVLKELTKDLEYETPAGRGGGTKRSWNQLHGSWGKRDGGDDTGDDTGDDAGDGDLTVQDLEQLLSDDQYNRELWGRLQSDWGKRMLSDGVPYYDDQFQNRPSDVAVKRSWNQLHGSWGKRQSQQGQVLQARDHWNDKRGWNKLHGGWGKRAEQPEESRSVPALVSPAKSPVSKKEWSNLRGAWGKRELLTPEQGREWSRKRESGWNNLKGLWG